jgi:6-phosphogluconolactonase
MPNRRTFLGLAAGVAVAPGFAQAQDKTKAMPGKAFFYVSLGPALKLYRVDADAATLSPGSTVTAPEKIQYVWPHPSAPFVYVASSNGGSALAGVKGATGIS